MRTALRLILFFAASLSALPALAALPPNYQRLAELRAVLALADVATAFGTMQPIDRIEYAGPDLYRVTAGNCHAEVRIVTLPTPRGLVGARRFEARPGRAACAR